VSAEVLLDLLPIHQPGEPDQRVAHVQLLVQAWAEQLDGLGLGMLGAHCNPWGNLQGNELHQHHIL